MRAPAGTSTGFLSLFTVPYLLHMHTLSVINLYKCTVCVKRYDFLFTFVLNTAAARRRERPGRNPGPAVARGSETHTNY